MANLLQRLFGGGNDDEERKRNQQQEQTYTRWTQDYRSGKIDRSRYDALTKSLGYGERTAPQQNFMQRVGDVFDANSPADQFRRKQAGLPEDYQKQSIASRASRAGQTAGFSTLRAFAGLGQDASGLYDLVTPGHGNNRFTKQFAESGRILDQEVKNRRLDPNVYVAGQVPVNVGSFMLPGAVATRINQIPKVARATQAISNVASKTPGVARIAGAVDNIAVKSASPVDRTVGRLAQSYMKPTTVANVSADSLQNAGHRTSLGQDNNAGTVATDIGMSLAMQGGLNLIGQGAGAVGRKAGPGARNLQADNLVSKATGKRMEYQDALAFAEKRVNQLRSSSDTVTLKAAVKQRDALRRDLKASIVIEKAAKFNRDKSAGMSMRAVSDEGSDISVPSSKRPTSPQVSPANIPASLQPKIDTSYRDSVTDPMQATWDANPFSARNQTGSVDSLVSRQESPAQIKQILEQSTRPRISKGTSQTRKIASDSSLPLYDTKKTSNLDKAVRSTRSIVERQGEDGKQLAGLLQRSRDTEELFQADILTRLKTVRSLKGKAYDDFVSAVQGETKPTTPKVAQAVAEWREVAPDIRLRSVDAGLDVGNLGPTYYPHIIDYDKIYKDKNTYNQAINHLVNSGQAKTNEEAIALLGRARDVSRNRRYGNLESARLIDLPFYDRTSNSLISYVQGASRRIAQAETFGKQDEIALDLINKAGIKGYDAEAMKNAYDVAVGAKQYNPNTSKFSGGLRAYNSTTRLGLGAITNASQSVNTGVVTGHLRTLGSMVAQLDPKNRSFVERTGVVSDAVLNDLKTQQGFVGKTLGKVTAPGFNQVEKFNRSVAAVAGKRYADNLASRGKTEVLRKLGVTGGIGKKLTEAQQIQAARKIVEKTQFKVDPQDLPGWVDSPLGKIVAQFRTFSYNQSKFFSNEVLKPMARGNVMPLARIAAALPVGYALAETKRNLNNRPEEDDKTRNAIEAFGNIGGAGLAVDMFRSMVPLNNRYLPADRRVSMAVSTFGGPSAGLGAELVGAVSEATQKKDVPEDGLATNKLPVPAGEDQYHDVTQLARLGLRQIPAIGTRLQNTYLPYKEKPTKDQQEMLASLSGSKKTDYEKALSEGKVTPEGQVKVAKNDVAGKAEEKIAKVRLELPKGMSKESEKVLTTYARLSSEGKTKFNSNPDNKYSRDLAEYERDVKLGKLKGAKKLAEERSLHRQGITKKYSDDTKNLYSWSKSRINSYLKGSKNGQKLYDELIAMDNALYEAGLIATRKFKYGLGSGRGGGRGNSTTINELISLSKSAPRAPKTGQVSSSSSVPRYNRVQLKRSTGTDARLLRPQISKRSGIA